MTPEESLDFLERTRPAISHIFDAIDVYNECLVLAQKKIEEIDSTKDKLNDLFCYRDQWSPNANHHYAQYMERLEALGKMQLEASKDSGERLTKLLSEVDATTESMSNLGGSILQIGKQVLSLRHARKPIITSAKMIGSQSIVEVIWEGRNHSMHWEEGSPRRPVGEMLKKLTQDLGVSIEASKNNSLSILGVLGWNGPDRVLKDLGDLIQ